jgi:UDP-N-acetylmuramoylalanine--D-glutamate ligase
MEINQYFTDKKITIMGLGLLGRGLGDAAYLAQSGAAEVIVTDLKTQEELRESYDQLKQYSNIEFVLGEHRTEDFTDRDLVLVAAGVPLDSPYVHVAHETSRKVTQSAALFAELSGIPIIGVTGTRGKSTVTHMIHHVLSEVTGEQILLGGNVRGLSNLQLLEQVQADSLCVMELDSWQLQGWGWSEMSPQIAVFTNFMEDHLNYYQQDGMTKDEAMGRYFADKANIFKYQEDSGVCITTPEVFARAQTMSGVNLGQEVTLVDQSALPEDALLAMPGEHNRLNASLAYEALKAISLNDEEIFAGLASFPGVPGRLEYLGATEAGVAIFNDNNSTVPVATVKALEALGNTTEPNIILIAGGAYKKVDPDPLLAVVPQFCKQVILLPGTGTDMIKDTIGASVVADMKEAVERAMTAATPGDIVLLSPGFASFGLFKNEYERNDQFVELIAHYTNE